MKLELKHLAPYLSHKLKVSVIHPIYENKAFEVMSLNINDKENFSSVSLYLFERYKTKVYLSSIKPILLPLSEILNIPEIMDEFSEWHFESFETAFFGIIKAENKFDFVSYTIMELMFKNHVDIYGLIDAGLAIDKRTLK